MSKRVITLNALSNEFVLDPIRKKVLINKEVVKGEKGEPGPQGEPGRDGIAEEVPDLTLIFENKLIN